MVFSCRDKFEAVNENDGYDGNAQPGGGKGRDHRGVQSIHGVAAQRFIRVNNSDPPPIRAGQNLQQQQRQKTKKQAPPNTISVPRTRNSINVPGGDLSNVCAVSALTVDINAEGRVLVMLKSDQRRANPDCVLRVPEAELFNVPHSTLKRCVLPLRIPGVSQDVLAIGQSTKAKIARALCFMHAENLLDFFASVDTTEEPSVEPTPPPSSTSWPPPLEEKKVTGVAAAPKERDFHSWDAYVDASERYVHDTADKARADVLARGQIPLSGHPIADRAAVLMRRHRQQFCHPQVLGELNESMSDGSRLIRTAHLASKVFVATLKLDPTTGLTATGVAKSSKDARRECAGHALCILQLLQQEAEGLPQGSPLAVPAAGGARGALPKRSNKGKKEEVGEDATLPGATLDAVLQHLRPSHGKLLRFFNLLFDNNELSPTTTFTRETTTNGTVLYHCQLTLGDITCSGKGVNRFEAQRSAMDGGVTELLLYDTRLQTLQSFIDTYPAITPELIPSAALPRALVERLRQQLQPVAQRQLAAKETKRTGARAPDEVEMEEDDSRNFIREEQALVRISERAFATDPFYNAQMLDALLSLRQHPTYLVKFHPRRSTLAMAQVRQQVLDAVQHHRVTVVCGTTGCGKTTQVPQYLLDHEIEQGRGGSCNILVTQPRRLSSFSVAERIAHERLSVVGKDVGYAVRLDARPGRHITICTTGVLLQIFSTHPELEHVSHLIIDEVHERDINCDVVLALVKGLLTRNPRLRVVLMSATMQSEMFAKYFGEDTPVIQVEGAVYPVSVRYLEDIAVEAASVRFYSPNFDIVPLAQDPEKGEQANQHITSPRALMRKPPKTDYNLIAYLVHRAVQVDLQNQTTGKSILVFLPGWKEMVSAKAAIEHYGGPYAITSFNMRFHLILLHSTVDSAKQRECFVPAPAGMVKVVLATNIAESGITIDDAAVVIDTGLIKTTTWAGRPSPNTSLFVPLNSNPNPTSTDSPGALKGATTPSPVFSTQLTLGYASQANGTQRKGRAGRTQHGVCYRLYTKSLWDALPAFPEADIHRVPLTQILLKLLSLGYAHPRETLQTFLEPPSPTNVEVSMRLLRDIGAVDEADQLTPLGEYLAKLPCDPRIGKMIIVGAVLRCLDSVLTVAACADVSPYVTSREQAAAARKKRYLFARSSQSDHISFLNAFNAYCANGERDDFARFNLLQLGNIRIISKYKAQYRDILLHAGLISEQDVLYGAGGAHTAVLGGVGGTDVDLEEDDDDDVLLDSGDVTAAEETGATMPARNPINPGAASTTAAEPTRCYTGELCVDTSQQSCNSCDVALVKACVCAALFPNVAVLRPPPLNAGSSLRRKRQAEKVELRTKHFTSIKPSKESACRRVGGPREQAKPNCTELLSELSKDAGGGAGGGSPSSSPPSATAPAMFYVFQDVFSVRESRQEFLTTLSSVSLWALLLFGASESTVQYYSDLSLCIIDGWIAVHIDNATYRIVTELRQALYTCLRDKYHHPRDEQNNTALRSVTEMCQAVLKAPVLELSATATEDETEQSSDETSAATRASRLVDTGSIVDPLALVRHNSRGADTASANGFAILGVDDGADASDDSGLEEEEEEGVVF
ncbi:ATP-dependent RNA helicase-like protein [Leptomonas pyrrhocoris]|uniref:RNA helicase n=1 Tax=Leptomonas pyrrhocoris TaxID=157538 RepID=A0A0N0VFW6_LEPPY|nr:ATP-dependent RNA helicase-like protein [Leptomonas pyrrhocoris]XP_015660620.1 ATP-dependent RNA helicase-like protein [Leptomonas pyrrhocoris]KPA82180.1 ATP-dependent RNA helicase-like protein [Leptomonas pyrrhocoris]KPA82181.1 ATP-dependent RNA helicase-like protein [Leptomonas pyrrhocoris]|eukprot:XP_015660619.1 ATP-dependent RNA helicase-like protein [Leptomonas pyrrhocoris]